MAEEIGKALGEIQADDIRLDPLGRVVITSPTIIERLKEATELRPDELAAARRDDTNIICCGNKTCPSAQAGDLGTIVERFVPGGQLPASP